MLLMRMREGKWNRAFMQCAGGEQIQVENRMGGSDSEGQMKRRAEEKKWKNSSWDIHMFLKKHTTVHTDKHLAAQMLNLFRDW